MNFKTGVTCFIYISLVGRLGLGAWSWVRIGLAEKVWFSVTNKFDLFSRFPASLGWVLWEGVKHVPSIKV